MELRFLLDENLRGTLWNAIRAHNAKRLNPIDVLQVGDAPAPALATGDSDLLRWAEHENRLLVTFDKASMPGNIAAHLAAGRSCPGVLVVRANASVKTVVEYLALVAHASDELEWRNMLRYIP